jgi:hypothetical protein
MCRGEIVFSNNLGMRNGPLFERKSYLEYKKAYEEGYYNDEDYSEDGYDDEESEGDEYDEEESEVDEYDEEESEDGETISEKDYMDDEIDEIEFDENDFNNERNRFDEENRLNTIRSSSLVSYRCQFRMCQKGIAYLTQPNPTKYTFRPHPCSYLD